MHLVARCNAAVFHQIAVGFEIVHHLGGQAADVDGVGGGQMGPAQIPAGAGGKHVLHPGLGVVEVAPHGAHLYVIACLGGHLQLLHGADAAVGVEHHDPGAGHVVEALQRRLAGVAAGGGENHHVAVLMLHLLGFRHQMGQHAEGHVLKGAGGAPEQLQHIAIPHRHQGGQLLRLELAGVAAADKPRHVRKVRQHGVEDFGRHGLGVAGDDLPPVHVQMGHVADIEPAVGGDALQHRLGGQGRQIAVACAVIFHGKPPMFFSCIFNMDMIHCPR